MNSYFKRSHHIPIFGHTTSDRGRSATSPAATPSPGSSGITVGPDPEISSLASPPSSPTVPSPTLGRGKRQKKAHSVLKDYVCHTAQVLPPASSTPTNGSNGPRYPLANFISCKSFSAAHTQFLDAVSSGSESRSYKSLRNWFAKLSTALRSYAFLHSHPDHTLFTYRKGDIFLFVLVYVDDLILAGNNSIACSSFKQYLNDCFKLKDLGPLKYFFGIEAARGPRGLFLSQRNFSLLVFTMIVSHETLL
ncbi:hypothetical protein RJ639_000986 [Escallonia herrerae]|uniref:Reverse transcriptase Ty1/copia-type domain-containing protein n=1 Tax=Escallonia herrerae TaxID=1293975 RepID=A0AA88XE78_9ASTE|nr:hypothetical protein RJ639_000986 [Escallonia herrerae]